ncbi:MAG: peptide chain release factor N(5)-glutamine methyltransferase [Prevotella sp.]|nr:peptide chain release factor N(5)-glutamine methyltransferase [Prevotella sp.]
MTYRELWQPLVSRYTEQEAKAVARYLLEVGYGLSMADILSGAVERISSDEMGKNRRRLLDGEPVQYVVGKAEFGGRLFRVTPSVLIPRPETLELIEWEVSESFSCNEQERILDIGTGSGCIAVTLALAHPNAYVEGWDISDEALEIARQNARDLNAEVSFRQVDVLGKFPTEVAAWTTIISNPPYICKKEADEMESHVLDQEPHQALFVPDEDPLIFYRTIAQYGRKALADGGWLYFEINPLFYRELTKMLDEMGYFCIETRKDQFGKIRFMRAKKR